jgi:hypothetical protein
MIIDVSKNTEYASHYASSQLQMGGPFPRRRDAARVHGYPVIPGGE